MRDHEDARGALAQGAALAVAAMLLLFPGDAARAQGKQEDSLTQRAFNEIVETKSSVEGEPATSPPEPIHNLSDEEEAEVEEARGIKVISGKDWKKETPAERDAHLRRIKSTMPPNSHLLITVPQGDVWLIGGEETDPNYESGDVPPDWRYQLLAGRPLRSWTPEQRAALPVSVPREKKVSQSDKRGTGSDGLAAAPEER
jgi:hypothetical protein